MIDIPGYAETGQIYAARNTRVYAGRREKDGLEVVLKQFVGGQDSRRRADHEMKMLRLLAGDGVARPIELVHGVVPTLVLERAPGLTLRTIVADAPLSIASFLEIARRLARSLARIHAAKAIHRDLKPQNILVAPQSFETTIVDFGLSAPFAAHEGRSRDTPEGTLAFIAPEQTGRMNRGIDFRSDLYSFGAVLYFMLTARPPFDETDPLSLIHAHLARMPPNVMSIRRDVPATIARLVEKLLQKQPEARYQSAHALAVDLEECLSQLERTGTIDDELPLATSDFPMRPLFSKRLYGRAGECAKLEAAVARIRGGPCELFILEGPPGAGKSALISPVRDAVVERSGYLAQGKFDLYRHELPYHGLRVALESLAAQLLVESTERLDHWTQRLQGELGKLAAAVCDLAPEFTTILKGCPPLPALGPRETQARLGVGIQRLLRAFTRDGTPLVLVLEDLQWMDGASLAVLRDVLTDQETVGVLVVATVRDSDEGQLIASQLTERAVRVERLRIGALPMDASAEMLADALHRRPEDVRALAELIERKTGNHPLLIERFVDQLHASDLLRYEPGRGWQWDHASVESTRIPDGAVALMVAKLETMGDEARNILEIASCIGDEFDVEGLARLVGRSREHLFVPLCTASDAGLIAPCVRGFRFVHDRIREAAQTLISDARKVELHRRAADILEKSGGDDRSAVAAIELADHLNRALPGFGANEHPRVIRANVAAAQHALVQGASTTAAVYLRQARALFSEACWKDDPQAGTRLFLQAAACECRLGDLDACHDALDALEGRALSLVERAFVTAQRMSALVMAHRIEDAISLGLAALRVSGLRWSPHPSRLRLWLAVLPVRFAIARRGADAFAPSTQSDETSRARLVLISALGTACARSHLGLVSLSAATVAHSAARDGFLRGPQLALAAIASYLCRFRAAGQLASRFAEVSRELCERIPDPEYNARTAMVLHGNVYPWLRPRIEAVDPLGSVREQALELGDREFALYALSNSAYARMLSGAPIGATREALRRDAARGDDATLRDVTSAAFSALQDDWDDRQIDAAIEALDSLRDPSSGTFARLLWAVALCVLGRHEDALAQCSIAPAMGPFAIDVTFCEALCCAALAREDRVRARTHRVKLARATRWLTRWARHGPDFVQMRDLVRGEQAALAGRTRRAMDLYHRAERRAIECGYVHHAALACEREAHLLLSARRETDAARALERASALYSKWGATTKVHRLQRELPDVCALQTVLRRPR